MTALIAIVLLYYGAGLAWLMHGHITGWLECDCHPLDLAIWTVIAAAVWPWFVWKILRDLANGIDKTNLR